MKKDKDKTQSWLDKLQQESWQLELIISSILLLIIGSYDDKIPDLLLKYNTKEGFNFAFVIALIIPILLFVKSNLIGHIFFRGLWIGCIGLRYISKDVDFNSFEYSNKFDNFLKKKAQPFDIYIEKLERICSIIFSYSFLMVFHFLSFALFFTIIQFLNYYAIPLTDNPVGEWILVIITLLLMISGLLNFIDFITIGKLKKTKYISNIFYPFYRIYNTFTLAFLYRPIHYNFISNKLGRIYMLLMLPYMLLLAFTGNTINFNEYTYIPRKENAANWVIEDNYDSLRKKSLIHQVSIDKLFYHKNEPIKLFLRIDDTETTNQLIEKICPDITSYDRTVNRISPFDAITITNSDDYLKRVSPTEHKAKIETSILCISKMYEVSIDSNRISPDYVFYQHSNSDENGILTGINTNELENGKHNLIIKIRSLDSDTIGIGETIKIPFFKN